MRPIDADALRDKLHEECSECGNCSYYNPDGNCHIYMMLEILDEAPTIEAEPVRHGRWHDKRYDSYAMSIEGGKIELISIISARCAECGHRAQQVTADTMEIKYKFCPHCGTRMDGDAE